MLTAVVAALALLLIIALGVVTVLWQAAALQSRERGVLIRHQCERIDGYRAELDALSIAPPPIARAALTPDDPSLLPAEVEQWLRTHTRES